MSRPVRRIESRPLSNDGLLGSQLAQPGDLASLRFLFAKIGGFECDADVSPTRIEETRKRLRPGEMEKAMLPSPVVDIKAFVPSKDSNISKAFYTDLGFTGNWRSDEIAELQIGSFRFLLQRSMSQNMQEIS